MKKATKSLLTIVLAFIILLANANVAFAFEIAYPGVRMSDPTLSDASAVITMNFEDYFDMDEFNDYLVEQLKVTDCSASSSYGFIDISQFKIPYSEQMTSELQTLIWYNSPELFRIYSLGFNRNTSTNTYNSLIFAEYYTKEEYAKMHTEMVEAADKLLVGIKGNDNLSDVDKALLLHDRIAITCQYDYDTYLEDYSNMPQTSYNAYGVLVLRDAVCMGYTLAYDYLLGEVGIKSDYCKSDLLNHAWNIVYIDNKPYHVDITWDDPTWDMSGRVLHTNFLRSTAGIKETGHHKNGSIDYISTPTDTTYDDYYWQSTKSAFQFIDNEYYYHDATTNKICKLSNILTGESTVITSVPPSTWTTSNGGYWPGNFVKLSGDSRYLYYSTKNKVYRYDPETDTAEVIFEPDLTTYGAGYWIYGMVFSDCKIMCEIFNSPNYTADVKKNYTVTVDVHTPSDWITTKEPTTEEDGEKQQTCLNCSCILNTEIIPKVLVCATENTDTIIEENIVFTGTDLCNDIETLVKFSDSVTYEISASFKTSSTEFLGTGSIISIYENDEKIAEYKIIVNGDLNGDSVCDVIDASLTELSMNGNRTPSTDECFAANGMAKEEIDINSFQYVVNTALE